VDALDWQGIEGQLEARGFAVTEPLLDGAECDGLAALFDGGRFRSTVEMARHRFGDGRYRYFDHPLPPAIAALRESFYGHLAPIANEWSRRLRGDEDHPLEHAELLERCRAAGPGAPDAADPALRRGRLERPSPGPLRRRLLPLPGPDDPRAAGDRLRGRRVRPRRAAPACPEPRPRPQPAAGRVRDLPHPPPPQPRSQRLPPGRPAPRRQHPDPRLPHGARNHLPRRQVISGQPRFKRFPWDRRRPSKGALGRLSRRSSGRRRGGRSRGTA
jgi:Oxygenase, catalysing oxidative methylation of damaged DNA